MTAYFRSHPLLPGGHLQTLGGLLLPHRDNRRRRDMPEADVHFVALPDGDQIALHEDRPLHKPLQVKDSPSGPELVSSETLTSSSTAADDAAAPSVLLIHGLGGCHQSPYMQRLSIKLARLGYRAFRMDQRNSGAAAGRAAAPYHGGRSEDVATAVRFITDRYPQTRLAICGFSLAGNMLLKFLGEDPQAVDARVMRAVAVNPPIDLDRCVQTLDRGIGRLYDRYFIRMLNRQVLENEKLRARASADFFAKLPRGIREFDDRFTAPMSGYEGASDYYARCSARQFIGAIQVPTLVLTSGSDPLVPVESFEGIEQSSAHVTLDVVPGGGHLGYIHRARTKHSERTAGDRRWMDWRVLQWVEQIGV